MQLGQVLRLARPLWDFRPFDRLDNPWAQGFPSLWQCLETLADDAIDSLDSDQQQLLETLWPALVRDLTARDEPCWDKSLFLWRLPLHPRQGDYLDALPGHDIRRFSAGIKGRKWEQISRFARLVSDDCASPYPFLEWCAGKGHLGRLLGALTGKAVISLEWQQSLCEAGEAEARRQHIEQQFICADAFSDKARVLSAAQHALALHACGELHLTLLRQAAAAATPLISISPCCYHLIKEQEYHPLSQAAADTSLVLDRHALQLPLNHAREHCERETVLRHREIHWRLAFDALQRHVRGVDAYLPLPAVRQSQLNGSFADFCHWGAAYRELNLPHDFCSDAWLEVGARRQRLTRRLDLAAHLFRPLIEQFLLLDRVAFLQEAGYQVSLSAFCEAKVTPRNALIHARRGL